MTFSYSYMRDGLRALTFSSLSAAGFIKLKMSPKLLVFKSLGSPERSEGNPVIPTETGAPQCISAELLH